MARQYTAHLSPRLIAVFSNEIIPNLVLDYRCCASKILMLLSSVFFLHYRFTRKGMPI